jgi:ribonuclease H / adenosylcobalamin/alpha-ribazole phosphatase
VVDDLDEIDFGAWTGRSFAELAGDDGWQQWNSRRSTACPPGGEPMSVAANRIMRHLDSLARQRRSYVLCVSHCDIIRGAIASFTGAGFDRMLDFEIEPGSLSSLIVDERGTRLLSLNQVPQ